MKLLSLHRWPIDTTAVPTTDTPVSASTNPLTVITVNTEEIQQNKINKYINRKQLISLKKI